MVADLDDFKDVNDRFGHAAGDVVLREFAQALEEGIRDVDLACRWGGEEFVLVLPGTDLDGAVHLAERIRKDVDARLLLSGHGEPIPIRASFGVAVPGDGLAPQDVLAAADTALYRAKRAGKNCVAAAREPVGPSAGGSTLPVENPA